MSRDACVHHWQQAPAQGFKYPFAPKRPDMAKVFPPAQLKQEILLGIRHTTICLAGEHLRQADQSVGDVRPP